MHLARIFFALTATLTLTASSFAQEQTEIGGDWIPFDAMTTVLIKPAAMMSSESTELYPWEVLEAWSLDNVGLSLRDCESIKVVVPVPGPGVFSVSMIVKMKSEFDASKLNEQIIGDGTMIDVGDQKCYLMPDSPRVVVHQFDAKTLVISSEDYLDNVVAVAGGNANGELAMLANASEAGDHISVLFAVEPVRAMIMGFVGMMGPQVPPPFQDFLNIPELLDAVLIQVSMDDTDAGIALSLIATDEPAAEELQEKIINGLQMARQIATQQALADVNDTNDPIQAATAEYAARIGQMILDALIPVQDGRKITFAAGFPTGGNSIAMQGMLVGMLVPAVQSARFAARSTAANNNMIQIGLAMHNYHDTYNKFPGPIVDDNGDPLLSWRVAILPFIDQQALYQQFHLDEPWDSDHNKTLLAKMPSVYADPNTISEEGFTVYQVPVGDGLLFNEGEETRIRDILDGTSNTVMVFQSSDETAVEWTKPENVTIDLDDPVKVMANHKGMFKVTLADGSIRDLSVEIASEKLKAMLTRDGREIINFDF